MDDVRVRTFLGSGYGYGYGSGSGDGYGYGYCDGDGSGDGSGDGYGYGSGDGYGDGYGYGSGDGYGYGYCDGSGDGYGYGYCDGDGYGYGYGDGDGYKIKQINGEYVYRVDGINTIIRQIKGNVAKGFILRSDLMLVPCYVVKQDGKLAHGETLRAAMTALRDKLFEDMPEADRIAAFLEDHKASEKYPARDLWEWHHRLTGSCEMGRNQFAADHSINLDEDQFTVEEFISLTKNAYGSEVIRHLDEALQEQKEDKND